jgi:hypothetical protein
VNWVRRLPRQSWHGFRQWSETETGVAITLCGRRLRDPEVKDALPAGRSCENCLRIYGRAQDK